MANVTDAVLVIGYGNTLRSDDGVGQRAAQAVADWHVPNVRAITAHQLMPELVEDIAQARLVIFVDANSDLDAPDVDMSAVVPVATSVHAAMTHAANPGTLLALAQALYGRRPEATLVSIHVASFDLGDSLSPTAQHNLAKALREIHSRLHEASASEPIPESGGAYA